MALGLLLPAREPPGVHQRQVSCFVALPGRWGSGVTGSCPPQRSELRPPWAPRFCTDSGLQISIWAPESQEWVPSCRPGRPQILPQCPETIISTLTWFRALVGAGARMGASGASSTGPASVRGGHHCPAPPFLWGSWGVAPPLCPSLGKGPSNPLRPEVPRRCSPPPSPLFSRTFLWAVGAGLGPGWDLPPTTHFFLGFLG